MDFVIASAAQWALLLALTVPLILAGQVRVQWTWLLVAILLFALELMSLVWGRQLLPFLGGLQWNWAGKILGILATIGVLCGLWFVAKQPPSAAGITLRIRPGSLEPALMFLLVLFAFAIAGEIAAHDGTEVAAERLAFQATVPGLDEELFWRGTLLLAMNQAFRGKSFDVVGAELSWAGLLTTLLFGTVHAVQYGDGGFSVSLQTLGLVVPLGFAFYWLRERTGSVMIPILAHNVINFSKSFF